MSVHPVTPMATASRPLEKPVEQTIEREASAVLFDVAAADQLPLIGKIIWARAIGAPAGREGKQCGPGIGRRVLCDQPAGLCS